MNRRRIRHSRAIQPQALQHPIMALHAEIQAHRGARRSFTCALAGLAIAVTSWFNPVSAQERRLDTAFGPVAVKTAERVVTLDEGALDTALAVGMKPVGSVAVRGGKDLPTYLQDAGKGVKIVGTTREPNLEAILAQRPDVILASPGLEKRVYDILSKIAPTVVPSVATTAPWQDRNALYVAALGKEAEYQKRVEEVEARIEALRARAQAGQTFTIVRWMPQGPMAMSSQLMAGRILTALGLQSTDIAAELGDRPHSDILSLENLGKVDADWLLIATLNEQGQATLDAARKQPAFTRLKAAQSDHAVTVDGQVWSSATGVLAANRVVDDIERLILK
jgi:ABC-type Fe3+-hydroxamate transport system, periplasmic component